MRCPPFSFKKCRATPVGGRGIIASRPVSAGQEATHFRAHPRREVVLRAMISLPSGWRGEATVRDLSLGGVGLTLSEPLRAGDRVIVSFLAPSLWDPLAIPARVAWVGPPTPQGRLQTGLAFEPKDPMGVFALFELLSTLA